MDRSQRNVIEIEKIMLSILGKDGFKKKKKHMLIRLCGECIQHISILETKIKGKDEVYISIAIGFSYEKLNKCISFIRGENYDSRWATSNINMTTLINNGETYGFYVNEFTNLSEVALDIAECIQNFAYQFWEKCNNMQKYKTMLINKDDEVCMSTYTLKRPEWNLLALSLLLNDNSYDRIMCEYKKELIKNKSIFEGIEERISQFKEMEEHNG